MARFYTTPDGTKYPLTEAKYDMTFKAFKSDRRRAKPNNPHSCLLALGIRRDRDVLDAYIGSGKDAYIVFKGTDGEPDHAVHFTIGTTTRRIIDAFDVDKKAKTQLVILRKPSGGRTLDHRRALMARRTREIKDGSPVKRRGPQKSRRVGRLGVHSRPRPRVSEGGSVSTEQD
jgi:hypothetical protein